MKKILALLLTIATLLVPMTAFAGTINPNVNYVEDKITINGVFTDADAKNKIATLLVLGEGSTLDNITGPNIENDHDLILWADQYLLKEDGKFTFTINTYEMPDGTGYNFYISVPDCAETFNGSFSYNRVQMEAALVAYINQATASGISNIITGERTDIPSAKERIIRTANVIANSDQNFDKDVVGDYKNLGFAAKNNVNTSLQNQTFTDLEDFVKKLRQAIDTQPTGSTTPPAGGTTGGTGGGGGGGTGGGGGFSGTAGGAVIVPPAPVNPFLDIANSYWGRDAIVNLYNKGIVKGQGNGYFRPDNTITRAEFVQMVVVAFDFIMQGKTANFTDVTDSDWFANSVRIAYANGVVNGTTDTTFSPSKNITRQDMMTILYNAAKAKGVNLTNGDASFTDAGDISAYAHEAVAAMVGSNVVSGYTDGSVKPLNNASRAEAAAMLSRLLEVR